MNTFNVNLYREMRLEFVGIEAETPEAAAIIAAEKLTSDADNIEDCNGENLSSLVDVAGDADFSQSVTVDFEPERQRKAAGALLVALERVIAYAENEAYSLESLKDSPEAVAEAVLAWEAVEAARAAIILARPIIPSTTPPAGPRFDFTHEPEENPDRAYVLVDGAFDVNIVRTGEGLENRSIPDRLD